MAVAAYREPDTAAAARRRLRPRNRKVRTYRLVPHENARQTVLELIDVVKSIGDGVLHVVGWPEALGGSDAAEHLYALNFLRESVVEHPATQVWWMPVAFRDAFMLGAPDAWSVVKLRFRLEDDEEYLELSEKIAVRVRSYLGISPTTSLTRKAAEKLVELTIPFEELSEGDAQSIGKLKGLSDLDLAVSSIPTLEPFADLPHLTRLSLSEVKVPSFAPLSQIKTLEVLEFQNTNISDLSPLSSLHKLKYIDLWGTDVKDLTPIAGLNSLVYLNLNGTQVSNILVLRELSNLAVLNIGNTPARVKPVCKLLEALPKLLILW